MSNEKVTEDRRNLHSDHRILTIEHDYVDEGMPRHDLSTESRSEARRPDVTVAVQFSDQRLDDESAKLSRTEPVHGRPGDSHGRRRCWTGDYQGRT